MSETLTIIEDHLSDSPQVRYSAQGPEPVVLTDIYDEQVNIAIWQRQFDHNFTDDISQYLKSRARIQQMLPVTPDNADEKIAELLGDKAPKALREDICQLVEMFCCLFELESAGLRLVTLDKAMCPKFHIDRVVCRLVATYQGCATEWLPHAAVNREKLGSGSGGLDDSASGLYQNPADIQQLGCGDVALLKGELWQGNENAGLVHRSPATSPGENRLLLTLDFID